MPETPTTPDPASEDARPSHGPDTHPGLGTAATGDAPPARPAPSSTRAPTATEGAATASTPAPRTVEEALEKGEPRAPQPTSGPALKNSPEQTHDTRPHRPSPGRDGPSTHSGTTGGETPTPRDGAPPPARGPTGKQTGTGGTGDGGVRQLLDTDHGRWQVTTEASIYILDLDEHWLLRVPGAGPHAEGQVVAVNTLPHDHQPLPLLHVAQCEVGERMWLLSEPNPDGSIGRRVSTNVLDIRPTSGPPPRPRRPRPPTTTEPTMPTPENGAETPSALGGGAEDDRPLEGPFTDYGQFGVDYLDTRVLWQNQVWVDRTGTPHALHEMTRGYLTNVIEYLHGRAAEWHLEALLEATAALGQAMAHEVSPAAYQEAVTQTERMLALDPVGWIEETPLMAALRRQLHTST